MNNKIQYKLLKDNKEFLLPAFMFISSNKMSLIHIGLPPESEARLIKASLQGYSIIKTLECNNDDGNLMWGISFDETKEFKRRASKYLN